MSPQDLKIVELEQRIDSATRWARTLMENINELGNSLEEEKQKNAALLARLGECLDVKTDLDFHLATELLQVCRRAGISFTIDYSEPENNFSFSAFSASPSEDLYIKRCYSIKDAIDRVKGNTQA